MFKILLLLFCVAFISYMAIGLPRLLKWSGPALIRYVLFAGAAGLAIIIVLKIIF